MAKKEEDTTKSTDDNNNNSIIPSQPPPPTETSTEASTCCICRSGSAADTQYLADEVRCELVSRQILYRTRGTVTNAAKLLRSMLVNDQSMSAGLICTGYDHVLKRGVIYSLSPSGSLFELPVWAAGGSGSTYILGHIDSHMPHGEDDIKHWEEKDAVEFVMNAIQLAIDRDGSSGGFVGVYVINRWGKKSIVRYPRSSAQKLLSSNDNSDDGGISSPSQNQRVFSSVSLKNFASPSPI
uniref:Proteasome endopeptidase complex n=1 Tax=Ditylum brightwellii TaxID=49249 RepID=A0A7S4WE85_9STRA|mmetsp:Transcript_21310/g.31381  ORF Transcript_21310/g.31381 Transcript_21310/m.31381 type:complete len:239 (-) Transcript_21310:352-1068(-)